MSELPEDLWEYELLEVPEAILGVGWYSVLFHPNPEVTREVWILRIFEDGSHRVVKQYLHQNYMKVNIYFGIGNSTCMTVHRLVAFACYGKCPDGHSVDHIESDKILDNHPSNLRYATYSEQAYNRKYPIYQQKKLHMDEITKEELGEIRDIPFFVFKINGIRCTSLGYIIDVNGYVTLGSETNSGYYCVQANKIMKLVHQVIAETFLGHTKEAHHDRVNHKNNNGLDNRVENLEWCDAKHNGAHSSGKKIAQICPKEGKVLEIFLSINEAARIMKCDHSAILNCITKKNKTAEGYAWAFIDDAEIAINEKRWEHYKRGIKIKQICPKTNQVIATFDSMTKAAESVNGCDRHIWSCANGKRNTHRGFMWKYNETNIEDIKKKRIIKKKVQQLDPKTNEVIATFDSGVLAAKAVNGDSSTLSKCIRDKLKTYKGFAWRFLEDS